MQPAKSLRKLRSVTTAYLEDGGALIHNIDTLLRDVRHTLQELESREQAIIQREQMLLEREVKLAALSDRVDTALQQLLEECTETPSVRLPQHPRLLVAPPEILSPVFGEVVECPIQQPTEQPVESLSGQNPPVSNRTSSKRQKNRRRPFRS